MFKVRYSFEGSADPCERPANDHENADRNQTDPSGDDTSPPADQGATTNDPKIYEVRVFLTGTVKVADLLDDVQSPVPNALLDNKETII